MQRLHPAPAEQLAFHYAGVLRPLGTEIVAGAVRHRGPNQLRECLGQTPPALFTVAQRLLGVLELRDVNEDSREAYGFARGVANGSTPREHRGVGSILVAKADFRFVLGRLAGQIL